MPRHYKIKAPLTEAINYSYVQKIYKKETAQLHSFFNRLL